MRQIAQPFIILLFILIQCSCNQIHLLTSPNKDFVKHLNSYIDYLDSSFCEAKPLYYIVIETIHKKDITEIKFWYSSGLYNLIHNDMEIIDFVTYKKRHLIFMGEPPKCIMNVRFNNSLNIVEDIGKKYYKKDYDLYKEHPALVGPTMNDYMLLTIKFKGCNLISVKRQYY